MSRILLPTLLLLAGCSQPATVGGRNVGEALCKAEATLGLVWRTATQELAADALKLSGARVVRWLRPNTAVTMEFRPDRLNITLDDKNIVERINCG